MDIKAENQTELLEALTLEEELGFTLLEASNGILPQLVLPEVTEEEVRTQYDAMRRSAARRRTKQALGVFKHDNLHEHVFTDGGQKLIPIENESYVRDVSSWAGLTLRRTPTHSHSDDGRHVIDHSREPRALSQADLELYQDEDPFMPEGYPPLAEKFVTKKAPLKILKTARARAKAFNSTKHR
jgi:hypothetical protein